MKPNPPDEWCVPTSPRLTFLGKVVTVLSHPINPYSALGVLIALLFCASFYLTTYNARLLETRIVELNRSLIRLEYQLARLRQESRAPHQSLAVDLQDSGDIRFSGSEEVRFPRSEARNMMPVYLGAVKSLSYRGDNLASTR